MLSGAFGLSILRDDPVELQRRYLQMGVTSCLFCPGNQPWETMHRLADNARRGMAYDGLDATRLLGLYWEGPFKQPDRSKAKAWPHPVIAGGRLFIRDQDVLLCYDVRAKADVR